MIYCNKGLLQSSINAELTAAEQTELDTHLQICHDCRQQLATMTAADALAKEKMALPFPETQVGQAWLRFDRKLASKKKSFRFFLATQKQRKTLAVAAVLMFALTIVLVAPVRVGLAAFLNIFRVNQLETVNFTVSDLQKIQAQFYDQGTRDIDLRQFGQLKLTGGETQEFNRDELSMLEEQAPFPFRLPVMPENFSLEAITLTNPITIELTPAVRQINQLIETMGGSRLLPPELEGESFTISSQGTVQFFYLYPYPQTEENMQSWQEHLTIQIIAAPEIFVPDGTDVNAIREAVLSLPFLPQSIRRQLVQIEDWQTTFPIPIGPAGRSKEVLINGNRALYLYEEWGDEGTPGSRFGYLVWLEDQMIYVLSSGLPEDKLLAIAHTM
ncbi:MAG TPA: hypothetical protein VLH18_06610 [Candidatus Limnocylindrales bacterium]|nr:hypothetical protein [Candidatus Limnocylindrales bacterium]